MENTDITKNKNKRKGKQGFASMVAGEEGKMRQAEIAASGGIEAHKRKTAHEWTPEEAKKAGQLGGRARAAKRKKGNNSNDNSDKG